VRLKRVRSFLANRTRRFVPRAALVVWAMVQFDPFRVYAGPPLITDDPDTPGRNRRESVS